MTSTTAILASLLEPFDMAFSLTEAHLRTHLTDLGPFSLLTSASRGLTLVDEQMADDCTMVQR